MSARSLMAAALADELEARGIAALGLTLCEEIIEAVIESAAGACNRLSAREPSAREPNMLRIIDKASADPVSLAEAKAQLRVTDSSNDVLIKALIPAATNFVQSLVQRVFVSQTLEWVLPCWRDELGIPIAPVTKDDVASIKYVDWVTQSQQTLDPSLYIVQTR